MKVKVGEITKIKTGKLDANASSTDGKYPFFTCSKDPLRINSYSYDCECVLVAGNGDLNVKYYNGKFDAYQRTYIIEDNSNGLLYMPYLYHFLEGYIGELRKQSIGGVIKYIKLGNLTDVLVELPSIEEQKYIVNLMNISLELIELRKKTIDKLDSLVKARFIEMFGNESNPFDWPIVTVDSVADVQVGVVIKPAQYYADRINGIKTFRSLNVGEMNVKDTDWVYFSEEGNRKNIKSILKEHDLLIIRSGAPGTACVIEKQYEGCNVIDLIIAHPNKKYINPYYLCMFTNSALGKRQIDEGTGGAAQQHFNVGKYKKMKIFYPPMAKQQDFECFFKQVDKSRFDIKKSIIELEREVVYD